MTDVSTSTCGTEPGTGEVSPKTPSPDQPQ